jgi:trypsin
MEERGLVIATGKNHAHAATNTTSTTTNHEVPYGRFPYFGGPDNGRCGCTLIHDDVMVSAAHCAAASFWPGRTNIHLGGIERDGDDAIETIRVARTMVHPNYNIHTLANDIMLIKLESLSTLPVAAWNNRAVESRQNVSAADTLIVIGYGDTFYGGPPSTVLLGIDVPVVDHATCNGSEGYNGEIIDELMICAGAENADACQGM